jgi:hypothetical protein
MNANLPKLETPTNAPPTEERLAKLTGFNNPSTLPPDSSNPNAPAPTTSPLLSDEDLEEQITRHSFASSPLSKLLIVAASHAEGRTGQIPTLIVWQGSGLTINFSGTGERIVKAWLDDPSRLTMDFDAPLCTGQRPANCSGASATAIHLKRIHKLNFPQLPSTPRTLLTVVVEGTQGRKTYYFTIGYGSGAARYIAANVNTDPRPAIREGERESSTQSKGRAG